MAERDSKGRFVKGHKSNGGRPKMEKSIKDLLLNLVPAAISEMERMLTDPNVADSTKAKLIDMIFDRVYGKPYQSLDLGDIDRTVTVTFADPDMEQYGH